MVCWMGMIDLELIVDRFVLFVYILLFLRFLFLLMDVVLLLYVVMFILVSDKEMISFKFL